MYYSRTLIPRLVNEAPLDWCSPAIVPPSIADAAAAAALDEAASALLPALRPAARRLLACMRPSALAVLEGAGEAHAALAAADRAAAELPGLLAAAAGLEAARLEGRQAGAAAILVAAEQLRAAATRWMAELRKALPFLNQGPSAQQRLARLVIRGLAAAASIGQDSAPWASSKANARVGPGKEVLDAAAALLVRLLQQGDSGGAGGGTAAAQAAAPTGVQEVAYDLLLQLVAAASPDGAAGSSSVGAAHGALPAAAAAAAAGGALPGVVQLLLAPQPLEFLITEALHYPSTRRAVARMLLAALTAGGRSAAQGLLEWRAWVDCYRGDPEVLSLVDCLDAWAEQLQLERQQQQRGVQECLEGGAAPGGSVAGRGEVHASSRGGGERGAGFHGGVETLVRRLFSRRAEDRRGAGRALLEVVAPGELLEGGQEGEGERGEQGLRPKIGRR